MWSGFGPCPSTGIVRYCTQQCCCPRRFQRSHRDLRTRTLARSRQMGFLPSNQGLLQGQKRPYWTKTRNQSGKTEAKKKKKNELQAPYSASESRSRAGPITGKHRHRSLPMFATIHNLLVIVWLSEKHRKYHPAHLGPTAFRGTQRRHSMLLSAN